MLLSCFPAKFLTAKIFCLLFDLTVNFSNYIYIVSYFLLLFYFHTLIANTYILHYVFFLFFLVYCLTTVSRFCPPTYRVPPIGYCFHLNVHIFSEFFLLLIFPTVPVLLSFHFCILASSLGSFTLLWGVLPPLWWHPLLARLSLNLHFLSLYINQIH